MVSGKDTDTGKHHWDSFKDARTWVAVALFLIFVVNSVSGYFDYISFMEYISLAIVSAASLVYLHSKIGYETKWPTILLFVVSFIAGCLVCYRQILRYENYEISYDFAFLNTELDDGTPGLQMGICLINPNPFPVFARVGPVHFALGKRAGAYEGGNETEDYRVEPYSSNSFRYTDAVATIEPKATRLPSGQVANNERGNLRVDIEYSRDEEGRRKPMKIDTDISLITDFNDNVKAVGIMATRGVGQNSYGFAPKPVTYLCKKVSPGNQKG